MDITKLVSAWSEKNHRVRKPTPAEIAGVGTVFVRQIMVDEKQYLEDLKTADSDDEAVIMAHLLCHETGERLNAEERDLVVPVLRGVSRADYHAVWNAASGVTSKAADAGN